MRPGEDFFNLYNHALVRAAVAVPAVRVADPAFNARQVADLIVQAAERRAVVVLFPELCLSAYSCEDLFHQLQPRQVVVGGTWRRRRNRRLGNVGGRIDAGSGS